MVVRTALFIHLLDQLQWNLLQPDEVVGVANDLLSAVAVQYGTSSVSLQQGDIEECLQAWSDLIVRCARK
jgi:hypothetical protein